MKFDPTTRTTQKKLRNMPGYWKRLDYTDGSNPRVAPSELSLGAELPLAMARLSMSNASSTTRSFAYINLTANLIPLSILPLPSQLQSKHVNASDIGLLTKYTLSLFLTNASISFMLVEHAWLANCPILPNRSLLTLSCCSPSQRCVSCIFISTSSTLH